ncbi:hypothetical protein KVR01_005721 [Diaporthe batatas]|uniref:uncharacterized protein n=1 Tax=Diaporthe batatas TaxID=748121 RepID=UPI001D0380A4|nr:uncharacterized protein KVR01_005721 [Diaporthe batatas]KAG8165446.1 hypothetical protein KVR01_005721 [Diaporthe batatas]
MEKEKTTRTTTTTKTTTTTGKECHGKGGSENNKPPPPTEPNQQATKPSNPQPTPETSREQPGDGGESRIPENQAQDGKKGSKNILDKIKDFFRGAKGGLKDLWDKLKNWDGVSLPKGPSLPKPKLPKIPKLKKPNPPKAPNPPEAPIPPEAPNPPEGPGAPDRPQSPDEPEYPDYPEGPDPDTDFPNPGIPPMPPAPPSDDNPGDSDEFGSDSPNDSDYDTAPEDSDYDTDPEDSDYETAPEYPPGDGDSEGNDDEGDAEEKEDKGKGREKCIRWQDFEEWMHYLDTPEKQGAYYDDYHRKKPKKPETPRPGTPGPGTSDGGGKRPMRPSTPHPGSAAPQHLECLDDVARVAIGKMKGITDPNDIYDEATERFIDGFEGEGEGSTAWQKNQDSPERAIKEKYGDRITDSFRRGYLKTELQMEQDTINKRLHTGEWVKKQMVKGKPVNVVDAYKRIDEIEEELALINKMYPGDKSPSRNLRRGVVWVA